MNFKKGDIVKVIKEDHFGDHVYPVGSVWEVAGSPVALGIGLVIIKDSRQSSGNAVLFKDRVEIIKRFEPLFKVGDMVKVKASTYIDDPSLGNIYRVEEVLPGLTKTDGVVYLNTGVSDDYSHLWLYWFNEVELVNDNSDMELVDIIQDKNLRIKELEKELFEEEKLAHYFFEHANKRFEIIQEQFKEIDSLKEENQKLITKVSRLEAVRINCSQRVRDLIAENEILKESLERKKSLKNFLTRKKD